MLWKIVASRKINLFYIYNILKMFETNKRQKSYWDSMKNWFLYFVFSGYVTFVTFQNWLFLKLMTYFFQLSKSGLNRISLPSETFLFELVIRLRLKIWDMELYKNEFHSLKKNSYILSHFPFETMALAKC